MEPFCYHFYFSYCYDHYYYNNNNNDINNDNNKNDNNNSTKVTHIGCMVVPDPCKDKCDPGWCGFSKIPPP